MTNHFFKSWISIAGLAKLNAQRECMPNVHIVKEKKKMHVAYFKSDDLIFQSLQMTHNKWNNKKTQALLKATSHKKLWEAQLSTEPALMSLCILKTEFFHHWWRYDRVPIT